MIELDIIKERGILKIQEGDEYTVRVLFGLCNALWFWQKGEPHAIFVSGRHSDCYVNCNRVLRFTNLNRILAEQLVRKLIRKGITGDKIDWVVSSAYAAIPFGQEVAKQLNTCFGFTEKDGKGQLWKRFEIPENAVVLQVEELITTMHTTREVRDAILKDNPCQNFRFLEKDGKTVVVSLVHRPNNLSVEYPDYEVISLMEMEMRTWKPEDCPLCKRGSLSLKPKDNWLELTKKDRSQN